VSKITDEAEALVDELNRIEYCPSVSTQGYETLIRRATQVLAELAWMRKELEE